MTLRRIYLETMEDVLRDMNKIVIDNSAGGSGVVPYLPLPEFERRARQISTEAEAAGAQEQQQLQREMGGAQQQRSTEQ